MVFVEKEIERLNAECLELEDQCTSLKTEVKEAWESYRLTQEKFAIREAELQDEIKQLQKAKTTDKQQLQIQMARMNEEVGDTIKLKKTVEVERDELLERIKRIEAASGDWIALQATLEADLVEARAGSIQGVEILRAELKAAESTAANLRTEHAALLHHSHIRQAELERDIAIMSTSLADKEKELQQHLHQSGRDDISSREMDVLRSQVQSLNALVDQEREKYLQLERRLKQIECEHRASSIAWDDERNRGEELLSESQNRVLLLEEKIKEFPRESDRRRHLNSGESGTVNPDGTVDDDGASACDDSQVKDLRSQVQQLSGQLLKKQALVQELQAERGSLKSRLMDTQARSDCNSGAGAQYPRRLCYR